ncbi:MAG: hypothetical protein M1840_003283 [Geoglossum simile]|nr:MAG: hypothetical protein M1840_003283 [Geoglossum simile]
MALPPASPILAFAWRPVRAHPLRIGSRFLECICNTKVDLTSDKFSRIHKSLLGSSLKSEHTISTSAIDEPGSVGRTLLYWAACRGDLASVLLLLQFGALPTGKSGANGPLHAAAGSGGDDIVQELLHHGAPVGSKGSDDMAPLCLAACGNDGNECVELLLQHGADNGTLESTRVLLAHGADLDRRAKYGWTSLASCVFWNMHISTLVLLDYGADYQIATGEGDMLLHTAVRYGGLDALELLACAGLVGLNMEGGNAAGETAQDIGHRVKQLKAVVMADRASPYLGGKRKGQTAARTHLLPHPVAAALNAHPTISSTIPNITPQPQYANSTSFSSPAITRVDLGLRAPPSECFGTLESKAIFFQVLEPLDPTSFTSLNFNPILLLRLSLEHNPSEQGKENFLTFILRNYYEESGNSLDPVSFTQVLDCLEQSVPTWSPSSPPWVQKRTMELANHLVYFFFLPFRGQAVKTPQPTPHLTPTGDSVYHILTLDRISNLRAICLARDGHRCMVSGLFDMATTSNRNPMVDDSGVPLNDDTVAYTEVAHIIPHALGETKHENFPLDTQKATFWDVMKLFYPYAERLVDGVEIDKPFNAMTLATELHHSFGQLLWYLEEEPEAHTYIFKRSPGRSRPIPSRPRPPNDRGQVQFVGRNQTDLPSRDLLALHRACAIILGLSGAGEYISKILRDEDTIRLGKCEELELGKLDLVAMVSWRLALC